MRKTISIYCLDWEMQQIKNWSTKEKLPISTAIKQLVLKTIERENELNDDSNGV